MDISECNLQFLKLSEEAPSEFFLADNFVYNDFYTASYYEKLVPGFPEQIYLIMEKFSNQEN